MDTLTLFFAISLGLGFIITLIGTAFTRNIVTYIGFCIMFSSIVTLLALPEPSKSATYECPCEVSGIVQDEVIHYNKTTGDTTITTFVDLSNCIKVD